jgi:hypothetical protein
MGVRSGIRQSIAISELTVDEPFAVVFAGGEVVLDYFETCGEEEGDGG